MTHSTSIKVGQTDGYSWIRIDGRGDVFLTPKVKGFTENVLEKLSTSSNPRFVFDMEECTSMDSTFMGMVAGLAIKLQGVANSCLKLCKVNSKNQESLEELGIDSLVEINPSDSELQDQYEKIRTELHEWIPSQDKLPDSQLILDTHKTLGSLNQANQKEFSPVINSFESASKK